MRFGIFIKNSTKYINKRAIISSWIVEVLSAIIIIVCLANVNKVQSCCGTYTDEDSRPGKPVNI